MLMRQKGQFAHERIFDVIPVHVGGRHVAAIADRQLHATLFGAAEDSQDAGAVFRTISGRPRRLDAADRIGMVETVGSGKVVPPVVGCGGGRLRRYGGDW
jgi:hypothetical protein